MDTVKYPLAFALIIVTVSLGFSQEDLMVLNHQQIGPHQRPLVRFSHARHLEAIDCSRCHHDNDQYGANMGGEGQACSECHGMNKANPVPLTRAFHLQCKGCHLDLIRKGGISAPVMCGQCHKKESTKID
ncbi:MAG: cytochrome c3 family protein [Deltaproteobacteria bacterium]|nr:cytochrome c3 family protein [Deltaproteobacteria bacterium]